MNWREEALCAGDKTGRWMAYGNTPEATEAARICHVCPVRPQCLEDALATPTDRLVGIRAGHSPRQIRTMREALEKVPERVPATEAQQIIHRLRADGFTMKEIGRRSRIPRTTIQSISRGEGETTHRQMVDRLQKVGS